MTDSRAEIRAITGLDGDSAIKFFDRMFAAPLSRALDLRKSCVLDCACGLGWLSAALLLRGAKHVVACDLDPEKIAISERVLHALRLSDRVSFARADVCQLPFADGAFDAVCTIETLEHVPIDRALTQLARVCREVFILETPHRHFLFDTHDTPYPMIHLVPMRLRGRVHDWLGAPPPNVYPTLGQVERAFSDFALLTPFKTFKDVDEWERCYPLEHPYQGGRIVGPAQRLWRMKRFYYRTVFGLLGSESRRVLDKVTGIYRRTNASPSPEQRF
jgi:SAM-dependent methyltransferase